MRSLGNLSGLFLMAIGAAIYKAYTKYEENKEKSGSAQES